MAVFSVSKIDEEILPVKLVIPSTIVAACLLIVLYNFELTFTRNFDFVLATSFSWITLSMLYLLPKRWLFLSRSVYLSAFHIVLSLVLIFITPINSAVIYMWAPLLFMSDYYYQVRGLWLSASLLFIVLLTSNWYQLPVFDRNAILTIIFQFVVIVTASFIISKMTFGDRSERRKLDSQYVEAEYEHDRLLSLINTMADAVIATDQQGKITTYNAAALDLLNTNKTLINSPIEDILKLTDANGEPIKLMQLASKTQFLERRTDISMPVSDSDNINLDISISRIAPSMLKSEQQGFTFLLRDITERKSLEEERDLFISEVSHELRTPITISEGDMSMAVLLAGKPKPDVAQIKASIKKAHEQVVYLGDMVNDLSALSRAQLENKGMEVVSFKITDVIDELMQTYRPQAEAKGLYFKTDVTPNIPAITTSKLYFKEIMQNFITNAIKYTKKGGVVIKAQSVDRDNVMLSVIDTGAGIARSEQNKVYQKFWRSEDPYTRSTSGTGLGLFITAKLAHRLGGYLMLESEIKKGSTFSIVLPVMAFREVDRGSVAKNEVANLFN
jgi:PAS domain S-box-containing protein